LFSSKRDSRPAQGRRSGFIHSVLSFTRLEIPALEVFETAVAFAPDAARRAEDDGEAAADEDAGVQARTMARRDDPELGAALLARARNAIAAVFGLDAGPEPAHAALASLGDDLRFVTITSAASLAQGAELAVRVAPSSHAKCERSWHWRADVGTDARRPTLCGRCVANLFGAGEKRTYA